jgi:uncharacterized protein YjbJ (UPF0337 family)
MNRDELKGKGRNLKGRIKEAAGALTGNKRRQAEGVGERARGAAQEGIGKARRAMESGVEKGHESKR